MSLKHVEVFRLLHVTGQTTQLLYVPGHLQEPCMEIKLLRFGVKSPLLVVSIDLETREVKENALINCWSLLNQGCLCHHGVISNNLC